MNPTWLPNAITCLRMALSAPLAWLILSAAHEWALLVALVAGGSDALDGMLAKRYGWQSQLGSVLDPLADKLMLTAAFVALALTEVIPMWLLLLVLARDVIIVAGAVTWHYVVGPLFAAPSLLSKTTTAAQIALVLWLLVDGLDATQLPATLSWIGVLAVAALTVASGLHYVLTWGAKARRVLSHRRSRT